MPALHETFVGTVRDLTADGNGVVEHANGQVFFVPGVWIGETVRVRVTGFKKRFGFAELVALVEAVPERVQPFCRYHGVGANQCGGCPWQFVSYPAQLQAKQRRIEATLGRLGIETVLPIRPSPRQTAYRNRAQLKADGHRLGYVAAASNQLVDVEQCPILTEHNQNTLSALRQSLPNRGLRPDRKQRWTTIDIDETVTAENVAINSRLPFRQANDDQNDFMRQWLADRLSELEKPLKALELFAGAGNFTEVLCDAGASNVLAVEAVADALGELERKALPGVDCLEANLFLDAGIGQVATRARDARLLVLDPPRDGFRLLGEMLDSCRKIDNIAYISCDLATFSRDLAGVLSRGFKVLQVQPLDQFPHTPHVELLAFLSR